MWYDLKANNFKCRVAGSTTTCGGGGGGGGTPGGAVTTIQFNDAGSFGGDDGQLTWEKTTNSFLASGDTNAVQTLRVNDATTPMVVKLSGSAVGNQILVAADTSGGTILERADSDISLISSHGVINVGLLGTSNGVIQFNGSTSGSAQVGAFDVAGNPHKLNLPTVTGAAGQVLSTDGGNPQNLFWTNALGTSPGAPTTSIQYNNAGTFAGSNFDYTSNGTDCAYLNVNCDALFYNPTRASGFSLYSPEISIDTAAFNFIDMATANSGDGGGSGIISYTASSLAAQQLNGFGPQSLAGFFRATVMNNAGAPSRATGLTGIGTTSASDTANGQVLTGVSGFVALNKTTAGKFISEGSAFRVSTGGCDVPGCVQTETGQNIYGLKVESLSGVGTVETAGIKLLTQPAPVSGNLFSIKADAGAGVASFGDGITFPGSTSGSASIGVAAVAGTPNKLLLPISTGTANQALVTDGANPQQLSYQTLVPAPNTITAVASEFLTSYTQGTGNFTQAQPATTDLSDIATFNLATSGTANFSAPGAASQSSVTFTGALFTGGTGTTTFPLLEINPGVNTAPTDWTTAGTLLGMDAPAGFTGRHIDCRINGGTTVFNVTATGQVTSAGSIVAAGTSSVGMNGRTFMRSAADGRLTINNNANTSNGLTRITFGTEAATNPAFAPLNTILDVVDGAGTATLGNTTLVSENGNKVFVTTNFTTAANTTLQTITGLTFNFPAVAHNWNFRCNLSYSQATGNAAVAFGIQAATNAPTNIFAHGLQQITVGPPATIVTGTLATLTTTTATNIVSGTPTALATNYYVELAGTLELGASANAVSIKVSTATAGDAVTVLRGSYCTLT